MAISKIILNGITQIDLTQDTVSQAGHILAPYIGHLNNGAQVTGTGTGSASVTEVSNQYGIEVIITTGQTPAPTPEPDPEPTPSGNWQTVIDDAVQILDNTPYSQFWISALGEIYPVAGEVWRITIDGTAYTCTATNVNDMIYIGNPLYDGGTDDGSNIPFCFYNPEWGAWIGYGAKTLPTGGEIPFKAERQVSS